VDEKLLKLKERKEALEARSAEIQTMKQEEVDCHALADEIMATVSRFEDLFPYGSIEEKKEFIGLFFDRVELDPDNRVGEVYMKRFPMPVEDIGKSFGLVAGARYTHQKKNFPPVEVIDIRFEYQGSAPSESQAVFS
jgi:hypothetical protein